MSLAVARVAADSGLTCEAGCDRRRWDGSRAPAVLVVAIGGVRRQLCPECAVGLIDMMAFQIADLAAAVRLSRSRRGG